MQFIRFNIYLIRRLPGMLLRMLIVQILVCNTAYAQGSKGDTTQYKVTSWTSDDGLSNTVLSLYQDNDGYLWIGSFEGLYRFDGNKFDIYNRFNTPDISTIRMTNLTGDKDGNLWISTDRGLLKYKDGKFTSMAGENDFFIEAMCLDERNNKILIGTRDMGLFEYDIENKKYKKLESFSDDLINAIVQDSSGGTWVGSGKKGLAYFKDTAWKYYGEQDGLSSTEITSLFLDDSEKLYVCTTTGFFRKEGGKFVRYTEFDGVRVNKVKKDADGCLWIATPVGVYKQNKDYTWKHINKGLGLKKNEVMDICFDREGSIWIGTYRSGLYQLRSTKFITVSNNQGLEAEAVGAIHEISKNKFLAGTTDGKLYIIEDGLAKPFPSKTKFTQRIYSILKDDKSNIWIASYDGLYVLTPDGNEKLFTEKEGLPTRQVRFIYQDKNRTYWIGSRNRGLIKMEVGDSPLNPSFDHFKYDELSRLHSTFVMSIKEDNAGNLLVATNVGGLIILSADGAVQHYSEEEGFGHISLNASSDKNGLIWIATDEGLSVFENGKFFDFVLNAGLVGNVYDIIEDSRGYCWMPTSKGIIRVLKQQLVDYKNGKIGSIEWKIYSRNELTNSECTGTSHVLKASDGALWFPMLGGVVAIHPEAITSNKKEPIVYIEKALVDTTEYHAVESLVIPAGNERVVFSYTALSLLYPKSARYKYKLEPFDGDWIEAGTERQAVYTSLPYGEYTFKVIACNNDGIWNTTGASLAVIKEPYFYQTWWFYTIAFGLLSFSTVAYVRLKTRAVKEKALWLESEVDKRTNQLKHKSETLEAQNREIRIHQEEITAQKEALKLNNDQLIEAQTRISDQNHILSEQKLHLEELNNTKDKFFSIVAHDFKSPLNSLKSFSGLLIEHIDQISKEEIVKTSKQLQSSVDNTIEMADNLLKWARMQMKEYEIHPERICVTEITSNICAVYKDVASRKGIEFGFSVDEEVTLYGDKNQITFVIRNLVNNAIKFTHRGGKVKLSANAVNNNEIQISISDNGIGISEDLKRKLFSVEKRQSVNGTEGEKGTGLGLMLSYEFLKLNNGTISIESAEGKGTKFTVTLPR